MGTDSLQMIDPNKKRIQHRDRFHKVPDALVLAPTNRLGALVSAVTANPSAGEDHKPTLHSQAQHLVGN
jgi:hypothetical protein